jgi:MFS family permease
MAYTGVLAGPKRRSWWSAAFSRRYLDYYPTDSRRYFYLGIVVVTSIVLYYLYYVEGAVTPLMLPYYHMSFLYFLYLLAVGNAIGAFTAFIGGMADRFGRANLIIYGTLTVALVQLVAIPHIQSKFAFAVAYSIIGFVEGIVLVSTAALMRDFSPQMGRGTAMGFWAMGPTLGSLLASLVATRTLAHLHPWQDQFVISGLVCMVAFVLSFFGLRELAPGIRDQVMVSEKEKALVVARAGKVDVERATAHPVRSMFRLDLVSSSIGISVFLLFYFASVSVLTLYWVVIFNRTAADANGINVWYAAVLSGALIVFGALSDRFRVRKPFMLVGAVATVAMSIVLLVQAGHPDAGYYSNVVVVVLLAVTIACAYAPWMAGYTEAVEAHNPALAATGLAVWGWILRIVVALSFIVLPWVVTTSTTLVDNQAAGSQLQAFQAAQPYSPPLTGRTSTPVAPASVIDRLNATNEPGPRTAALILERYPQTSTALPNAARLLGVAASLPPANARIATALPSFAAGLTAIEQGHSPSASDVAAVNRASPDDLGPLLKSAETLIPAQKSSTAEWRRWWGVCIVGQLVFLLLVFTMRGRWSPRAARRELEEHERRVDEELERLRLEQPVGASQEQAA